MDRVLPLCELVYNATYNCNNPYPNCTNPFGFQFTSIRQITQNIYNACPTDWRLSNLDTDSQHVSLTPEGCKVTAGSGFTPYPLSDIWARLTTWKFPLIQLIATIPRPPLGFAAEALTIFRLLGNPIGAMQDLLIKISRCNSRARYWKKRFSDERDLRGFVDVVESGEMDFKDFESKWKAFALLLVSCDEWGESTGDTVRDGLKNSMAYLRTLPCGDAERAHFIATCLQTANDLAADRATTFLPIAVAQAFFVGTVAIAFGRTSAAGPQSPTTFVNIEIHSIAFTALYFWILTAAFLASVIGASQTRDMIPRTIQRFRKELVTLGLQSWSNFDDKDRELIRIYSGGIYCWQPTKWDWSTGVFGVLPFASVLVSIVTGLLISYLVPPRGWDCRDYAELSMFAVWVMSWLLDWIVVFFSRTYTHRSTSFYRRLFWFQLFRDIVSTCVTFGIVLATQCGIFNSCSCWTSFGKTPLAEPEMEPVAGTLVSRIRTVYPGLAFGCIALQLIVVPALVSWYYFAAIQVFLQRDDNAANVHVFQQRRRTLSMQKTRKQQLPKISPPTSSAALDRQDTISTELYLTRSHDALLRSGDLPPSYSRESV